MSERGANLKAGRARLRSFPGFPEKIRAFGQLLVRQVLPPLFFLGFTLLAWELMVRALGIASYVLPAPSDAFRILGLRFEPILAMALITLKSTLVGFACGVGLGLTLGILIGSSRSLYSTVYPALC